MSKLNYDCLYVMWVYDGHDVIWSDMQQSHHVLYIQVQDRFYVNVVQSSTASPRAAGHPWGAVSDRRSQLDGVCETEAGESCTNSNN